MNPNTIILIETIFCSNDFNKLDIPHKLSFFILNNEEKEFDIDEIRDYLSLKGIIITEEDINETKLVFERGKFKIEEIRKGLDQLGKVEYKNVPGVTISKHTRIASKILIFLFIILGILANVISFKYVAILSFIVIGLMVVGLLSGFIFVFMVNDKTLPVFNSDYRIPKETSEEKTVNSQLN